MKNGRAETLDGALAGSTLDLWQGVKNFMKFTGASLEDDHILGLLLPSTSGLSFTAAEQVPAAKERPQTRGHRHWQVKVGVTSAERQGPSRSQ